jgi:2-oxoglutarate dehydrogenase E1 component
MSGQDCRRGTFSQRHAVWRDMETNEPWTPANHIREPKADGTPQQAKFCVYNSSLSEAAVLGFDYGYSLDEPDMLVLWEAQFGDFSNGAQTIIDQFILSSESKWYRTSGIVLLLPHGFEGQGPEHSNAYLERYLAGYAEENIQVANMTTPANYFHILRRQLRRNFRRPLVIMTPKSMLRHPKAVSPVEELITGHFREIIPDDSLTTARRVVLSAGKVYYDLLEAREKSPDFADVALVRVEQIAPLNTDLLKATVEKYGPQAEIVWCQEEPKNRGAWSFMFPHFYELFPGRRVRYAGRQASASPATGMLARHKLEQQQLVEDALR